MTVIFSRYVNGCVARCWPAIAAAILSFWLSAPATAEVHRVTVGLNHAPPYRIAGPDGFSGLYIELFEILAHRLGWEVSYREAPFRRVLWMMEMGQVDIMLGPLLTSDRQQYMEFVTEAFPPERKLFLYRNPQHRVDSYEDLYGRRVGVLRGASYFPRFDEDTRLIKESAARYENLFMMLARDYIDVIIVPELVGQYTAGVLGIQVEISPYKVPGEPSYIAVSRKSTLMAHIDDIRTTFESLKKDGVIRRLLQKYQYPSTETPE